MFPIHINDGTSEIPDEPVCYIVAKEGIFLKKNMGIMDSIAPVKNISILQSIQAAAKMNIKKIPGGQFAQVVAFFRQVYKEYWGESIVLLFYDEERRVYRIIPPHQKVTSAACDYNKGITIDGMQMIGTIHSHASMSAFHSGTDDKDEEHFDGLHITIGNVNQEDVSITASIVANGHRFVVQPEEYVERLVKTVDIDETEQKPTRRIFIWKDGKMVEDVQASNKYVYSYRKFDKRYKVNVSGRYHKVPDKWMDMVEKGTYTYPYTYGGYGYGAAGHYPAQGGKRVWGRNKSWGGNYDSDLWRQAGRQVGPQTTLPVAVKDGKPVSPFSAKPAGNLKPAEFPPHDIEIEDGNIPCQTCVFREHKLLLEEYEADEPDVYKCVKCQAIVVDDTDSDLLPQCPTCGTDEFMNSLSPDELPDQYIDAEDHSHLKKEPGVVENSSFITCRSCGSGFHLFDGEVTCPFCYALIDEDLLKAAEPVGTEDMRIHQSAKDSGQYLSDEVAEANAAALEEAQKADQELERIPDPQETTIPLPGKRKESKGFFAHFFGRKKGGNA